MVVLGKEQIDRLADRQELMDAVEEAYAIFRAGECYMPPRPVVEQGNRTLMYMPCFTKDALGTKILTIFPENAARGLPAIDGVVLLNDPETGAPLAILDGQSVTGWRTGAVGGVAIRHLSRPDSHTFGVVGAGTQAFYQTLYACAAREIRTVLIHHHRNKDLTDFIARLKQAVNDPAVEIKACGSVEDLVRASDIICTATPAAAPVLPNDPALLKGKCVIAIGSYTPEMREIPDAIWEVVDRVYIELPYACEESGDLSQPLASGRLREGQTVLMGDLLAQPPEERQIGETTYFKSVGMGLFDLCVAQTLWRKA